MSCSRPPERRASEGRPRAASRAALWVVLALALPAPRAAYPQDHVLLQGLADAETWSTDGRSELFSRNDGKTAGLGRLRLWAAAQLTERLQGVALGEAAGGSAYEEGRTESVLEQAYLRYTAPVPLRLVIEAGQVTLPFGNFARRYFSQANPLIGEPLGYEVSYPLGVQVNGAVARFDYMVAALDGPLTRQEYLSKPASSVRPAVALGVTPITGLRLGTYLTRGPYLGRDTDTFLPSGSSLRDFDEEILGLDLQFSRGHFELNGEYTRSRLQIPGSPSATGRIAYLEPKYTWSPRWFTALRLERGRHLEVEPVAGAPWLAEIGSLYDLEAGVGFRIRPGLLLKASYRTDLAPDHADSVAEGGDALAMQLSYSFDVTSWLRPPR
jgi:hypothetical protein